jgi:glyoxylase-like metal-dependent hydrolase (beta-lactamase superfamily II)
MFFKILFTGEHTNYDHGTHYEISPLTSSVAYLDDGKGNKILFDTGSLAWQEKLLSELKAIDVSVDEITHVLLTHFHLDHTANCILFKNAEIHANRSLIEHKTGKCTVYRDMHEKVLPAGIQVFPTPGHTQDHVSYFFEIDGTRYCFAGDAVRNDILEDGGAPHYLPEDRKKEFRHSVKMIFEHCDVIIPGHFEVIEKEKKEEYYRKISIAKS